MEEPAFPATFSHFRCIFKVDYGDIRDIIIFVISTQQNRVLTNRKKRNIQEALSV